MSDTSGEAIAAVVRPVLSVRGPMAQDDLLGVLDADGIDLGPDPDKGLRQPKERSRTNLPCC